MTNNLECVYCYHAPSLGLYATARNTSPPVCHEADPGEERKARVEFSQSYISTYTSCQLDRSVPRAATRYFSLYFYGLILSFCLGRSLALSTYLLNL